MVETAGLIGSIDTSSGRTTAHAYKLMGDGLEMLRGSDMNMSTRTGCSESDCVS
jgi:hypothetical protein